MNKTLELNLQQQLNRIKNQKRKVKQIEAKLDQLERELKNQEQAFEKSLMNYTSLGLKQPSKDQEHPDSVEDLDRKRKYNNQLSDEKVSLLEEFFQEDDPELLEEVSTSFREISNDMKLF